MHDSGQPLYIIAYNILDGLCKRWHLEEAIKIFRLIIKERIEFIVYIYTILIDSLCKGGRLNSAQEILQGRLIKGYCTVVRIYHVIINGFCKESLFDGALTLFHEMDVEMQ